MCVPTRRTPQLLDRLGLVLPKRMRLVEHELPAPAGSA
jgi:hypothetical protein